MFDKEKRKIVQDKCKFISKCILEKKGKKSDQQAANMLLTKLTIQSAAQMNLLLDYL